VGENEKQKGVWTGMGKWNPTKNGKKIDAPVYHGHLALCYGLFDSVLQASLLHRYM